MSKHCKSRVSTLTLICRNGFLQIKVRVKNLRPAGHPGRARLFFGKPVSHSPARPSLKKPGSVRPYPKPNGLAGWGHCSTLTARDDPRAHSAMQHRLTSQLGGTFLPPLTSCCLPEPFLLPEKSVFGLCHKLSYELQPKPYCEQHL